MTFRTPLEVKESWTGYKLVDADGRVIASAPAYPWAGVPLEKQPRFVLDNLTRLAGAANSQVLSMIPAN